MESILQRNYHNPSKAITRTDVHENAQPDSRATSNNYLPHDSASEKAEQHHAKPARHPCSWSALSSAAFDALVALTPLCFIVFGALVYANDGKPIDGPSIRRQLLEAAHYVSALAVVLEAYTDGDTGAYYLSHSVCGSCCNLLKSICSVQA